MPFPIHQPCANPTCELPTMCNCDQQMANELAELPFTGVGYVREAYAVLDRATVSAWIADAKRFQRAPGGILRAHLRLQENVACAERCAVCRPQCPHCLGRYDASNFCPCH